MIKIKKCKFKKAFTYIPAGNTAYLLMEYNNDSKLMGLELIYPNIHDRLDHKIIVTDNFDEFVLIKKDYLEIIETIVVYTYNAAYRFIRTDKEKIENLPINIDKFIEENKMEPEKENPIEEVFTPEQRGFKEGMIVKHFKREMVKDQHSKDYLYQILHIGVTHSETKEPMMVYQALYGDKEIYARPLSMFCSKVDKEKYPNIKQEFRLEPLDQLECIHLELPFGDIHEFETIEKIVNGNGMYKLSFTYNNWGNNIIALLPVQDEDDYELSFYFEQIFDSTYESASSILDLYKKYSLTMPFIQYKSDNLYEGLRELNQKLRTIWGDGKEVNAKEISIFYNLLHICQKYYNDEIDEYGIIDSNLLEGVE